MGKLTVYETEIGGLFVVETDAFNDNRGTFARWFCDSELRDIVGDRKIVNVNFSHTCKKGSIRGMHYQRPPFAEMKMVRCTKGRILDTAVDIREDSPTYLEHVSIELSADNMKLFIIPEGFAHGFQSLEDNCEIMYLVTAFYNKEHESGVNAMDPALNIEWALPATDMSYKDRNFTFIDDEFRGVKIS